MTEENEPSFEELVAQLEEITDRMAAGDIGIEDATALYEEAMHLHEQAADRLLRVQDRNEKLQSPGSD
jgi:exodeoxyribonuclease VII small subunit